MNFKNSLGNWNNEGSPPSDDMREETNGFQAGYKPAASLFNWFWSKVMAAISEIQTAITSNELYGVLFDQETDKLSIDTQNNGGVTATIPLSTKADAVAANNGFVAGDGASVGTTAGGVAIGEGASTDYSGGAIGYKTTAHSGFSGGQMATATGNGAAVGANTSVHHGGAVGYGASAQNGFAGGQNAVCATNTDCIQLGEGTNETAKTLKVYDYTLMNADGTVPSALADVAWTTRNDNNITKAGLYILPNDDSDIFVAEDDTDQAIWAIFQMGNVANTDESTDLCRVQMGLGCDGKMYMRHMEKGEWTDWKMTSNPQNVENMKTQIAFKDRVQKVLGYDLGYKLKVELPSNGIISDDSVTVKYKADGTEYSIAPTVKPSSGDQINMPETLWFGVAMIDIDDTSDIFYCSDTEEHSWYSYTNLFKLTDAPCGTVQTDMDAYEFKATLESYGVINE